MYVTGTPVRLGEPEKVPQEFPLQPEPLADHVTPRESVVVAVRERVCVMVNPARLGEMEMVMVPDDTRMDAVPVRVVFAIDLAVRMTVEFDGGGSAGAV